VSDTPAAPPAPTPPAESEAAIALKKQISARKAAALKAWKHGLLVWKLDKAQRVLHADIMQKRGDDRLVVLCSRGFGKTFCGILLCIEACLQKPNQMVALVAKTKKQAHANIRPSVEKILEDCPAALRPTYLKHDAEFVFKNGSILSLLGVDSERFDLIRGRALHGCFIDEAQDIDQLDQVVREVLDPCVLRVNGWMILAGTVPQDGGHDFVQFVREAQGAGNAVVKTIYDCPRYSAEDIEKWKKRAGGETASVWRREYLCQMVFSESRQVIPEWTHGRAFGSKETPDELPLVREEPRPEYCDKYIGLDFGFSRDLTVALFAHVNFREATCYVEDELSIRGGTTASLAKQFEAKAEALWGPKDMRGVVHVYADGNEARTIHELKTVHHMQISATEKKNKLMHINTLRLLVQEGRLVVHPRCKTLVKTLFAAAWNKKHNSYERGDDIGHADALDALIYLTRNIRWQHNPVPAGQHWTVEGRPVTSNLSPTAKAFGSVWDPSKSGKSAVVLSDLRAAVRAKLGRRRF
jgi:hypothetical protein